MERDLLGLLGRGHTAKSIATLRSMSETAVNERFRSARRKTGIGSSREIARLIVARENRHDFIGLAPTDEPAAELPRPDAHRRASHRWRLPMAAAVLLAAAILAQQTAVPLASPGQSIDSARSVFTTDAPGPDWAALDDEDAARPDRAALANEVAAGRRDAAWSSATEAALLTAYRALPLFADGADSLRARCSATLCEVTGVSPLALHTDPSAEVRFMILTGNALGLDQEYGRSRTTTDTPQKVILVAYWRRRTE
ncbi:hypothetical protein [Brevundimonas sp. TWP2-3-2]|uniref:hypothetical protein n=1 Tax=Brevundimonas sp. TWP2-3-2 TaxID=2804648 RepID=UPI003CF93A93